MKQLIRLTEEDIHRIVENAVRRTLDESLDEGQGWNYFKDFSRNALNGTYDKSLKKHGGYQGYTDFYKNQDNGFVKNGGSTYNPHGANDDVHRYDNYDQYGNPTNGDGHKINQGISGRIGRWAGLHGANAILKARDMYNRARGYYNQ